MVNGVWLARLTLICVVYGLILEITVLAGLMMNVLLVILASYNMIILPVQHNLLFDEWEKRPFMNRVLERLCYFFSHFSRKE